MAITDIPILSMLRTRLEWAQTRQKVLAENVANADTPKYRSRDLVAPTFEEPSQVTAAPVASVALVRTERGHIAGFGSTGSPFRTEIGDKNDMGPNGNTINLEDQMMKVAANQMDYQAATAVYTRSLSLIKTALGKR
jgi:flagellar basal-body rod protein FlgB